MKNSEIAKVFADIADLLERKGENPFKIRAYRKVVRSIEQLSVAVEQLVAEGRMKEIPGAGEAITKKITEMVTSGHLGYYDKLKAEFSAGNSTLPDAPDISPEAAMSPASEDEIKAVDELKAAIAGGKHWYIALLEAIRLWTTAEKTHNGRLYRYLIAGEAFDWLLLAERLCQEIADLLPDAEQVALLFHGKPPLKLTREQFKELIGSSNTVSILTIFMALPWRRL